MSLSRLPSGRWRAQVYDPAQGRNVSVGTFNTKAEAKAARERAREARRDPSSTTTVLEWWTTWTTDPLYDRPKASTNRHRAERTRHFARDHASLPLSRVDDLVVARWLAGGKRNGQVPALRSMWNDAASPKAGRLVARNPWAGLGISRGKGNANKQPPTEAMVWAMIEHARRLAPPSYAAWLQVAAFTGLRPGELDALRWENVDLAAGLLRVVEQWNTAARTVTAPKNGRTRTAVITPHADAALRALPRETEWCFANTRGTHYTPSSRAYYWKAVAGAAGWDGTLYLATRHFAGSYMVNVLGLDSEDVAYALGHEDGGELVRRLYGHRDRDQALRRVADAYGRAGTVRPLRVKDERDAG